MNATELELILNESLLDIKAFQQLIGKQQVLCEKWNDRVVKLVSDLPTTLDSEFSVCLENLLMERQILFDRYMDRLKVLNWEHAIEMCNQSSLKDKFDEFIEAHLYLIRMNEMIQVAISKILKNMSDRIQYLTHSQQVSNLYMNKPRDIYHSDSSRFFDQRR